MPSAPTVSRVIVITASAITLIGFGELAYIAVSEPEQFNHLVRKDNRTSTGLIEHLTVAVLIPGILAAAFALVRWRSVLPSFKIQLWLSLWVLACIYFAGEECSWGQWYFGFETPDEILAANDQGEFNLHNTTSWLDQKPRALVELFIIVAGLLAPILMGVTNRGSKLKSKYPITPWIVAPAMCWAAALVFTIQRVGSKTDIPWLERLGESEFREFGVAWFLTLYLLSYALRMGRLAKTRSAATEPIG